MVFSGGIAAWEQRRIRKTIQLKIFPYLLFRQYISKLFASHSTLCHLSMTQRSWENLDCIRFWSFFAVSFEVNKYNEAKNLSGICCTAVRDHTGQSASWGILFAPCPQLGDNGSKHTSLIGVVEWAKIVTKIWNLASVVSNNSTTYPW